MAKCKNCKHLFGQYVNDEYFGKWCLKIEDSPDEELERECKCYGTITQADRIRSMTDEELSKIIKHPDCKAKECEYVGSCYDCRLEWLRSPVEV